MNEVLTVRLQFYVSTVALFEEVFSWTEAELESGQAVPPVCPTHIRTYGHTVSVQVEVL